MLIIGELINASRKAIKTAIEAQDRAYIQKVAAEQFAAGAGFIDVNAGVFAGEEAVYLKWLVESVQAGVEAPCSLDSPDPKALEAALAVHKGTAFINSISLEKARYDALLPVVSGADVKVVALCMSDDGMPETVDARMRVADRLINALLRHNIPLDSIYVDPLVQPIAMNGGYGAAFLDTLEALARGFKGVHLMCGLSNISYGLPKRQFLNQTFMVMAIARGLDGAILNPLDKRMMASIVAAETLAGRDDFCRRYLTAYRSQRFEW